jgi:transposase
MIYAMIDIHKHVFQAAALDPASGELVEERFPASPEALAEWTARWRHRLAAVAIEATTGWRWVARELQAVGLDVRLADPGELRARQGKRRKPKTDRLDARFGALLLAKEMLPESWLPPAEIQQLRDRTRLRKQLAQERTRWAQRLHALLTQEGWPCQKDRLLTAQGRRWAASLALPDPSRAHVDLLLRLIEALEHELRALERELARFARSDRRCQALETIFGVGPTLACHLLAEIGQASRFRRARQVVRLAGLDPTVSESGDSKTRGKLSKAGPPALRWALVQAASNAHRRRSPDQPLYSAQRQRNGSQRARLTIARKIARRAYRLLSELETQAA